MFEIKPTIKAPRKIELWGIIIITCFNFAFLIAAVTRIQNIGDLAFWTLLVVAEVCFLGITYLFLRMHRARSGIDDMYDATIATNRTLDIIQKREETMAELHKTQIQAIFRLIQELKELKNVQS